jgi:hypothetical protein
MHVDGVTADGEFFLAKLPRQEPLFLTLTINGPHLGIERREQQHILGVLDAVIGLPAID